MEWVIIGRRWCDAAQADVELLEQRVYPMSDLMPEGAYQVVQRRCSYEFACNGQDVPCRWAFTNQLNDPFEVAL
jgi:hypothetical protein